MDKPILAESLTPWTGDEGRAWRHLGVPSEAALAGLVEPAPIAKAVQERPDLWRWTVYVEPDSPWSGVARTAHEAKWDADYYLHALLRGETPKPLKDPTCWYCDNNTVEVGEGTTGKGAGIVQCRACGEPLLYCGDCAEADPLCSSHRSG